jgi:hypothetical protein
MLTIVKRKQSAAIGEESATITFPVIKAEDHKNTNIKGKNLSRRILDIIFSLVVICSSL